MKHEFLSTQLIRRDSSYAETPTRHFEALGKVIKEFSCNSTCTESTLLLKMWSLGFISDDTGIVGITGSTH
jgi:hypothetical protein